MSFACTWYMAMDPVTGHGKFLCGLAASEHRQAPHTVVLIWVC